MERWKAIKGFEGMYEVSDLGRVKSLARTTNHPFRKKLNERILKGRLGWGRHLHVALCNNKERKYISIHKLVLQSFVGDPPEGMECCHNNGDPSDNRLSNLRWDTRKGNVSDQIKHGVFRGHLNLPYLRIRNQ